MTTNTPTNLSTELAEPGIGGPPAHHDKPKKRGLVWVVILLAIAGIAGFAVYRAGQPAPAPAAGAGGRGRGRGAGGPTPVSVAKPHKSNVPVYLNGLGNVIAFYIVTVKSRVDGQLMKIHFKEGETVKEGQLLAEIDPRPFEVQLQQAQGVLARDTALLTNARLDLTRYTTLLAQDAVPRQVLDTQRATVAQLEGNIKTDEANVNNARLQLTYANVVAPISGTVGIRLVDPGNIVRAGDPGGLVVITQLQPISAFFTIPEDALPQVMSRIRQGVRLTVDAFNRDNSKKLATGYLLTVDNQIDTTTGTSRLKAVFENKDHMLFPNQFVNMRLLVDVERDQIVIPTQAVQRGQQGPFVYVVGADSKVSIRQVEPGAVDGESTVIKKGIDLDDSVVTDGIDRLQNGSVVRVRRPGEDGGAGPGGRGGRGGRGARGAGTARDGAGASAAGGGNAGFSDAGAGAAPNGEGRRGRGGRGRKGGDQQ
jgi:multidrug efflux system membrane fusion protein